MQLMGYTSWIDLPCLEYRGFTLEVRATFEAIGYGRSRLIGKLSPRGEVLSFCHEASTCGYGVYREIIATGHHCAMVAPSLIPRKPGG